MARFGFGHKFHDLNYFGLDFQFHILWIHHKFEVIMKFFWRKSLIHCNFILFWTKFWQLLVQYHHLHRLLRHVQFFSQHKFLGFVDQHIFLNVHNLYFHKSWSSYIVLKHSHLNMCKGQELFTLLCLHPHDVWGVLGWFEILVWESRGILPYLYLSFRIRTTLNICKNTRWNNTHQICILFRPNLTLLYTHVPPYGLRWSHPLNPRWQPKYMLKGQWGFPLEQGVGGFISSIIS